jgi:UDPglucose--hexose-1-phosphate uridylyltransferase
VSPVRRDPLTGEPVLLAPARAARPHDVGRPSTGAGCPFCPGNEGETPPETRAVRPGGGPPDSPGWLVRAIPNKFPAGAPDEGVHEVIVNTPRHVVRLGDLTDEEASLAGEVWAERIAAVEADPRGLWPFLFLNQGAAAGASLQHTHTQLVGLPLEPPRLLAQERAFAEASRCPVCADLAAAPDRGRLVAAEGELAAWTPEVPPLTGTLRIGPAAHLPDWTSDPGPAAAARFLRRQAAAVTELLGAEAINLWLHRGRPGGGDRYHWHVDLIPRLGTLAGLELGTGVIAVGIGPAETAARLRAAPVSARSGA